MRHCTALADHLALHRPIAVSVPFPVSCVTVVTLDSKNFRIVLVECIICVRRALVAFDCEDDDMLAW